MTDDATLIHNMGVLATGLDYLATIFDGVIDYWEGDPETFGSGHFILGPTDSHVERFSIEEHYTGTDWADDDRLPTSWTWTHEKLAQHDGGWTWQVIDCGTTPSTEVDSLLLRTIHWVHDVRQAQVDANHLQGNGPFSRDAPSRHL